MGYIIAVKPPLLGPNDTRGATGKQKLDKDMPFVNAHKPPTPKIGNKGTRSRPDLVAGI